MDVINVWMKELSVEDLLLQISDRASAPDDANEGFKELYWRYSEALTKAMRGVLKSKGIYNPELVETTVNNVFVEIAQKPLNFSYDKTTHKSEDSAFRGWIYRIARFELADLMKASINYANMHVVGIEDEVIENLVEIEVEEERLSGNRQLLDKALSILSERDRAILLTYFDCHAEGKYAPTEVLDTMCEYWGTTRDGARQIKSRSLAKVKKQIERLEQLKPAK